MSAQPSPLVTADYIQLRLRHYLDVAKKELQEAGPDNSLDRSQFQPTATVIAADGTEANVQIGFQGNEEKRRTMFALSETCNLVAAAALIVRMVATSPNLKKVAEEIHLTIPSPITDPAKYRYFEERLFDWVRKKTGGSARFGALPREYTMDAIVVSAIGPHIADCGLLALYEWKDGELIVTDPGDSGTWQARFDMVPKWWD